MSLSLYKIKQEHLNIIRSIEENDGEVNQEILDALALTEDQFNDKAISYSHVIKTFENDGKIISDEIKRLEVLKERKAKAAEAFKKALSDAMKQFGIEKIESPIRKISFRKSESVEILDEKQIPEWYWIEKVTQSISKDCIKKVLKEGHKVPGAKLITKNNLQIK